MNDFQARPTERMQQIRHFYNERWLEQVQAATGNRPVEYHMIISGRQDRYVYHDITQADAMAFYHVCAGRVVTMRIFCPLRN